MTGRAIVFRAAFVFVAVSILFASAIALFHPESPLPDEWHPLKPLDVAAPMTPITFWKLDRAANDPAQCFVALNAVSDAQRLDDKRLDENCGISQRLQVSRVGQSRVRSLETSCATALRLAMWEHHGVQPAANAYLGAEVERIQHFGSFSCRRMRTSSGASARWSSHAQAMAVDVAGFDLADGRRLSLINDWDGEQSHQDFFRAIRDSACIWFRLTLSPDFNALHADHFHLQSTGGGTCR